MQLGDEEQQRSFADWPFFAVPCVLRALYPRAKFVHKTREFSGWFASFQYMVCKWGECRPETDQHRLHAAIYGEQWELFCTQRFSLCDAPGTLEAAPIDHSWWTKWKASLMEYAREHASRVRECIPSGDLLDMALDDGDADSRFARFLSCNRVLAFPRINERHCHGMICSSTSST